MNALIRAADAGDPGAARELFAVLYTELHGLAESHLRRQGSHVGLGVTTLVHEAYLQMASRTLAAFPDRARFFAYSSRVMRGIVIDRLRRRQAYKRGGAFEITTLPNASIPVVLPERLDALADAMEQLQQIDAPLAELVDLHFFCGFRFVEIAQLRAVSERTVQRDWQKARVLLAAYLREFD